MHDLSGTTIKGYELRERIGTGGMGAVYRAYQSTVGREVAIKVILPGYANQPDFIRRFESEAQLVARLEHMNIVPLYDYWRDPNGAYLVMRYLRGGSLKDALQQGPFDLEAAARLLDQVAAALSAAHRSSVIHRDIKPANILLDEDGNAYLTDFGIAKELGKGDGSPTDPHGLVGSPDYLSPEQASAAPVTPQTDIYSLGVVLYETLTGKHPFPGLSPVERLFKHINEPLPAIQTLDGDITEAVNNVIQKATAKNPAHRYADAPALAAAFRQAAALGVSRVEFDLVELLTPREQAVLQLIIDGQSNREIAEELTVELTTVKWYVQQIYRKLNVRSRVQAIIKARELNLIVEGVERADTTTGLMLPEPKNPYKGLRAFQAADERDFFGREKLTSRLAARLGEDGKANRFLAVVGPSGSGKSSLVKAGLIPALWRGELPGSEKWYIVEMMPGTRPLDELEVALTRIAADQGANIGEHLQRDAHGLLRAAGLILPDDGSELLVVVDQFEEVFTLVEDEQRRQHFLDLLQAAVTDLRSKVRVVVTLRADFYDRPLQYPQFGELMRHRVETVLPLSAEELERAISKPAEQAGVRFEEGLVASIIQDVQFQPGTLPLLQYALTELFDQRENRTLTHAGYQQIGRAVGALATRAEEVYNEFSLEAQETIRQMFLRLVTLGEGVEDTRRRVNRRELLAIADDPDVMDEVIDTYAAYRLLSLDHDPTSRRPTVEVAHEALLREWERLREWLNESRADIRLQRQLARATNEWQEAEQDPSFLLRGARLEQFEGWSAVTQLALTQAERDYLEASIDLRDIEKQEEAKRQAREAKLERRARTVLRALVAVFAISAIIAGGLAFTANNQRRRAEESEQEALRQASIGLAAQAIAELDSDAPERGVLLALEALENYPYTPHAERALAQTVYGTRQYITLRSSRNRVLNAVFSPDGTRIASTERSIEIWDSMSGEVVTELNNKYEGDSIKGVDWTSDGRILLTSTPEFHIARVWDVETGEELLRYERHDGAVHKVYVSKDDRFALTSSSDGTAHIWDIHSGQTIKIFSVHEVTVNDAVWSPDERQIATASTDGACRLWNVDTGDEILRIDAHLGGVTAVSWSPDGTRIATSGNDGLARVWDTKTGELLYTLIGHDAVVRDVEWSPDGTMLATAGGDGLARIWESTAGNELAVLTGGEADITSVSWSPDSRRLVVGGGLASRVWDVSSRIVRLVGHTAREEEGYIQTGFAYWSPDSQWVGTSGMDETYRIWDPVTGINLKTLESVTEAGGYVNPAGTEIFLQNPTRIMNLQTGIERSFPIPENFIEPVHVHWSPDGHRLVIHNGTNPEYAVYDVETREKLFADNQKVCSFGRLQEWSPNSLYLAQTCVSGELTSVFVVKALTGEVVWELEGHTAGTAFSGWSPDGSRLATPSVDQTVRVWNTKTGESLTVFTGHNVFVFSVSWSPNGKRIASGDTAGNVLIWDAETGQEVNRYNVGGSIIDVEWSPDGTRVLTTGVFDAPDIHPVWQSTEELIAYARDCCVFRDLTPEEREQFGLPPVGNAAPDATPAPDESSGSGAGVRVALLTPLPVAALVIWSRRKKVM